MNSFFNQNKSLATYSLIILIIIPLFGVNFLISIIGNILLLLFLIPLLLLIILFISFNSIKSNIKNCSQCGAISFGKSSTCLNCGAEIDIINIQESELRGNPSERTIEVQAEEV